MILLHTSDWHLGKRLMDRERLPEQEEALNELVSLCERERVEIVLVAGDVFDTYLPPAEAERLYFDAVKRLAGDGRMVVVISGNHDDAVRLSASAPLGESQGVFVFGSTPARFSAGGDRPVHVAEAGNFYLVAENAAGERVYINALSYPNEARMREGKSDEPFPDKMRRWIARGDEGYRGDIPHILLSHLFAAGGSVSESERDVSLGGARAVPLACFPQEGYVALGHLHRPQKLGKNVVYSGSLLPYSFDEAGVQKSVVLLETKGKDISFRMLPIHAGKRLVRLECNGVEEALSVLPRYADCFAELTLNLKEPLTFSQTQLLKEACSGLVSLIPRVNEGETAKIVRRSEKTPEELFAEYYRALYGEEPADALLEAFLSAFGEETP